MRYCDILGCNNKATKSYLAGLLYTCDKHKNYYKQVKYRILNLRHNCGKKSKIK